MPRQFSIVHRVQFSETDMAGVVHFSNFYKWMEEVEHAMFRSLGLSVAMRHEGRKLGWPRVSASCEFSGPARFEDEVEVRLGVARVGRKSLNFEVEFLIGGKRIATGKTTSVCCEMAADGMRSIAIPEEIRAKLH
jgi:acyl-CoA thioester hydrolase